MNWSPKKVGLKIAPHYPVAFVGFANLFRRFRACEILYSRAYPLDGYALMRDLKDRAFMMAAVALNRMTFLDSLGLKEGLSPSQKDFGEKTAENRRKVDNRITQEFIGKSSGLSKEAMDDLKRWDDSFNLEVHNASLTWTHEMKALIQGEMAPRFGPSTTEEGYAIYQNRSAEIGWIITRLLPFLQPSEAAFGDEWLGKRKILDDAFRHMSDGLATTLNKRIGSSFIELMDKKFRLKESFHYFESTYRYP
ncbi:MAG TPA: hypothetical protein VK752_22940 [Bryobacteraceae bacterium]|nr:hypothetical protein [Bryobacteraceae bacterium]